MKIPRKTSSLIPPFLIVVVLCFYASIGIAQTTSYETVKDIPYYSIEDQNANAYLRERCKLDIYYPKDTTEVATLVWFHGGGLESGEKYIPDGLLNKGIAVVAVNYRLHPKVQHPVYIEDAAAAMAWTFKNIGKYNGDPNKIFVSGHSAGGYLASIVGLDKRYLDKFGIDADSIAGIMPLSGHTITHFTIRKERGIDGTQPVVDEYAPLFHIRADAPSMLLITGDRELELLGRYEENAYFYRMMKVVGHGDVGLMELGGYGHDMVYPAIPLVLDFIKRKTKTEVVLSTN